MANNCVFGMVRYTKSAISLFFHSFHFNHSYNPDLNQPPVACGVEWATNHTSRHPPPPWVLQSARILAQLSGSSTYPPPGRVGVAASPASQPFLLGPVKHFRTVPENGGGGSKR